MSKLDEKKLRCSFAGAGKKACSRSGSLYM